MGRERASGEVNKVGTQSPGFHREAQGGLSGNGRLRGNLKIIVSNLGLRLKFGRGCGANSEFPGRGASQIYDLTISFPLEL